MTPPSSASPHAQPHARYSPAVALIVAAAQFMQILDGAIINTSLPEMARSFGVAPLDLSLAVTAYVLAAAATSPLASWSADRFGPRAVLIGAMLAFTAASVWCAVSASLTQLILARIVQGIGGALLTPVGTAVVMRNAAKSDFVHASALMVWPALIAPVVGPVLGGFITETLSWRWNFWLNLPLGIGVAIAIAACVPREASATRRPLDVIGFILCAFSLTSLLAGFQRAAVAGGERYVALGLIGLGVVLGAVAVRHLRRHPHPLLSLAALSRPSLSYAFFPGGLFRVVFQAAPFLLPLLFQLGFGLSPATAGLWVLFYFIGNLGLKTVTTPLMRRFGFRGLLSVNGVLVALSMLALAVVTPATMPVLLGAVLVFAGATRSLQLTSFTTLTFIDVPQPERGTASNLMSMLQQASQAAGVAASAFSVMLFQSAFGGEQVALPALRATFVVFAVLSLIGAFSALRIPAAFGLEVRAAPGRDG